MRCTPESEQPRREADAAGQRIGQPRHFGPYEYRRIGEWCAYRTHIDRCRPQKTLRFGLPVNPWSLRGPPKIRSPFWLRTHAVWDTVHCFWAPCDRRFDYGVKLFAAGNWGRTHGSESVALSTHSRPLTLPLALPEVAHSCTRIDCFDRFSQALGTACVGKFLAYPSGVSNGISCRKPTSSA
jgi:hypothetical protein